MFIRAHYKKGLVIELCCDLSHENFILFIDAINSMGFKTNISDSNNFKDTFNTEDEPSMNHTMWADEDTWIEILEIIKKIKNDL